MAPDRDERMSETLKVVFIGQRDWCDLCADNINNLHDARIEALGFEVDRPAQVLAPRKIAALLRADVTVRVGFRPGSRTTAGRAFEAFWSVVRVLNPRSAVVFYWIGTDVVCAVEHAKTGVRIDRMYRLAESATHIAVTQDLCDELAAIGIDAQPAGTPWTRAEFPSIPPGLPTRCTVLSYVPDERHAYYGGPTLLDAARALPDVAFRIMGGLGGWMDDPPPNVQVLGWVDDPLSEFAGATVVVRLAQHDGMGATAIEGLLYARHVIYTRPLPHCRYVRFGDANQLTDALCEYLALHQQRKLTLNLEGFAWARDNYLPEALARYLTALLLASRPREMGARRPPR